MNARIVLRHDSAQNWKTNNPILYAGEMGVEDDTRLVKVGDGTTNWNDLPYINKGAGGNYTQVEATDEQPDSEVLPPSAENGDVCVVRRTIADDLYSYTAYVYNGGAWKAMDGNYDADNIYFSNDLTATAPIGVITIPGSGNATISARGKNLSSVLASIMAERKNPTITQPSVTISFTNAQKSVEAGTTVTPQYKCTFNAGNYSFGPATGVTATSWSITDNKAEPETLTTQDGSFQPVKIGDQGADVKTYTATVTVQHSAGAIPKDNLGGDYAAGAIAAGSKTASTSQSITCFRNFFYGIRTETTPLDSAVIRTLTAGGAYTSKKTLNVQPGASAAKQVVVAVPANSGRGGLQTVLLTSSMNADITENYVKQPNISVEGADGYTAIEYEVWVYQPASIGADEVHQITLA